MKRFFLSLLAVVSLMLTACNMNELESVNRAADLINFTVTNGGMTKAVDVTTANLAAFEVTAFNHGTETSPYINAVSYTGGSGTFASSTPYYWPSSNLDFYAWSQGAATGEQVEKTNYKTFIVTPSATPASQVDLVFAGKTNIGKGNSTDGAIALNFRHAESKVVVKVKNTAPNLKFVISDWKLGFIDDAGTFTYSGQGAGYDGSTDGNNSAQLAASMWSNNTDAAATKSYTNTLDWVVNVAANASEALLDGEMIVIPQSVTAASAYASATETALVNGSYVGLKLKILNRENDAVIYSDGNNTAWAIWPANFAFEPGKKYTFTVDLCGGYYETNHDANTDLDPILEGAVISFASVTVDDFSQQSAVELVAPIRPINFAGLQIAPAPLYHNGSSFIIKDDDWNHDSYNSVYGAVEGSYYFNWNECHAVSDISYDGHSDWRMPSQEEWAAVTTGSRTGSTTNGTAGCRYALIQLTGVPHAGNNTPIGLLLAPDGETMTGMSKTFNWNVKSTSGNTGVTAAQLDEYLDAGCVFLPTSGNFFGSGWYNAGTSGYYWSSTQYNASNGYSLSFSPSMADPSSYVISSGIDISKASYYYPCRLVRSAQ